MTDFAIAIPADEIVEALIALDRSYQEISSAITDDESVLLARHGIVYHSITEACRGLHDVLLTAATFCDSDKALVAMERFREYREATEGTEGRS